LRPREIPLEMPRARQNPPKPAKRKTQESFQGEAKNFMLQLAKTLI